MKYRKLHLQFVISRVDKKTTTAGIAKQVDILKAIRWIQEARVSVSEYTICNCFQKCGFTDQTCAEVDTNNEEFASLIEEINFEVSPDDFIAIDNAVACYRTPFDTSTCEWRIRLCEETFKSHIASAKKICVDSDSSDDEAEYEEKRVSVPSIRAAIQMVDELTLFAQATLEDKELVTTFNSASRLLQEKRFHCLKQNNISDYFSWAKKL